MRSPMAITVSGDAQVVIQDAASYQQMVDELERSSLIVAVREGEKDVKEGRVEDLDAALSAIRTSLAL